jgi:hypothetical protein
MTDESQPLMDIPGESEPLNPEWRSISPDYTTIKPSA